MSVPGNSLEGMTMAKRSLHLHLFMYHILTFSLTLEYFSTILPLGWVSSHSQPLFHIFFSFLSFYTHPLTFPTSILYFLPHFCHFTFIHPPQVAKSQHTTVQHHHSTSHSLSFAKHVKPMHFSLFPSCFLLTS